MPRRWHATRGIAFGRFFLEVLRVTRDMRSRTPARQLTFWTNFARRTWPYILVTVALVIGPLITPIPQSRLASSGDPVARGILGVVAAVVGVAALEARRRFQARRYNIPLKAMLPLTARSPWLFGGMVISGGWAIFNLFETDSAIHTDFPLLFASVSFVVLNRRMAALMWDRRILVLRKFGDQSLRDVGRLYEPASYYLGRIVTLTESTVKPLHLTRLMRIIGASRTTPGPVEHVVTTDEEWKTEVEKQAIGAYAVLCDLGEVSDAIEWEIELLLTRFAAKTVFVSTAHKPDLHIGDRLRATGANIIRLDAQSERTFRRAISNALGQVFLRPKMLHGR